MKIVLDTNVFISGVFFGGLPYQILDAWRHRKIDIVLSQEIFDEYQRIATDDPEDDKFISCALASKTKIIVSGDKHLLDISGFRGVEVLTPRSFIETYIKSKS